MRKKFYAATAISAFMATSLLLAGTSFAANQIDTLVTTKNIGQGLECGVTSPITLSFDEGTTLAVGDKFTVTLPLTSSTSVTLCKALDFIVSEDVADNDDLNEVIRLNSSTGAWQSGTAVLGAGAAIANSVHPWSGLSTTTVAGGGSGIFFHITGSMDGQIITIEVKGDNTAEVMTVVGANNTRELELFKQKAEGAGYTENALFRDANNDNNSSTRYYNEPLTTDDNAFCIDVSNWSGSVVHAAMDSNDPAKFNFEDTNRTIAAITSGNAFEILTCKTDKAGIVKMNNPVQTGGTSCGVFNNYSGTSYCALTHVANYLTIESQTKFDADMYEVEFEILVNGKSGDNGVYFAASPSPMWEGYKAACDNDAINNVLANPKLWLASGKAADESEMGDANDCKLTSEDGKAIRMTTDAFPITSGDDFRGLAFTVDDLLYDGAVAGDEISVRVNLSKKPCGQIATGDKSVATLETTCSVVSAATFPYFATPGGAFWNGIAITNYSNSEGDVVLTMYEEDGDVAEATVTIAANSMYVNTLNNMIVVEELFTKVSGDGEIGDARSYITVNSETINLDGFSMIANNATGESMGYLPRQNK